MSIFDKVQSFRKKLNSHNDVNGLILLRPNESTFSQYIDEHLAKITSDITKHKLLEYSRYAFPHNSEMFSTILESINLQSKERKAETISVESNGSIYDAHLMEVSIIPLILNTVIYNNISQQDGVDAYTDNLSTIAINHFNKKGIDLRHIPMMPYEDAFYMNKGNFTEVPNEEDPQIVPSAEFNFFKDKYEKLVNVSKATYTKAKTNV